VGDSSESCPALSHNPRIAEKRERRIGNGKRRGVIPASARTCPAVRPSRQSMKMRPGTQTGFLLCGKEWIDGEPLEVRSPWDQGLVGASPRPPAPTPARPSTTPSPACAAPAPCPAGSAAKSSKTLPPRSSSRRSASPSSSWPRPASPLRLARAEVDRAVLTFKTAAEEAARLGGESLPLDLTEGNEGRWGLVQRFPVGPVLAITPFNFPLNLVAHKLAPPSPPAAPSCSSPPRRRPLPRWPWAK
jgi:hypothetical protein